MLLNAFLNPFEIQVTKFSWVNLNETVWDISLFSEKHVSTPFIYPVFMRHGVKLFSISNDAWISGFQMLYSALVNSSAREHVQVANLRLRQEAQAAHVHSSNKARIIPVTFFPPSFLFVSLTLLLSLCYAGLGCHTLKGTALTSMAFFSCLVRHQTPARARPLAPCTAGLLRYSGLDQDNPDQGLWTYYWLNINQSNISCSITKLLVLHLLRTQFEAIVCPKKNIFTQISP